MSPRRRSRLIRRTLAPLAVIVAAWLAMPAIVDSVLAAL